MKIFLMHESCLSLHPQNILSKWIFLIHLSFLLNTLKSDRLLCVTYDIHWFIGNYCSAFWAHYFIFLLSTYQRFFYMLEIFQTAVRQVSGECSPHEIVIPLEKWIYLATTLDSPCCRIWLSHEISCSVILNSLCIS